MDSGPPRRSVMIGRFDQAELEFDLPGLDTTEPQPYTLDNLIVDAADRALSEETVVGIGDDLPQSGLSGEALKNLPQPSRRDEGLETQLRVTHLVRFQKVFVKHFLLTTNPKKKIKDTIFISDKRNNERVTVCVSESRSYQIESTNGIGEREA